MTIPTTIFVAFFTTALTLLLAASYLLYLLTKD